MLQLFNRVRFPKPFTVICSLLIPGFLVVGLNVYPALIAERMKERPSYKHHPKPEDFYTLLVALCFYMPMRYVLPKYVFEAVGDRLLPSCEERPRWTPKVRRDRVERFGQVAFKLLHFLFVTAFGYYVLLPTDFLWPVLGGHGTHENTFKGVPFSPYTPLLKEYYMVELAYHTHSLLYHLVSTGRSDYLEMMLHHSCTLYLILFSYVAGFARGGSLVMILHDIADVFAYLVKCSVDTRYTKATLVIYAGLLISWAWTRFYVFPFWLFTAVWNTVDWLKENRPGYRSIDFDILIYMCYVLLALHIWWFCLFIKMGLTYAKVGVPQDLQHKVGGEVTSPSATDADADADASKKKKKKEE